jgi:hypothetical protein
MLQESGLLHIASLFLVLLLLYPKLRVEEENYLHFVETLPGIISQKLTISATGG